MRRRPAIPCSMLVLFLALPNLIASSRSRPADEQTRQPGGLDRQQVLATYAKLPLGFEANRGQTDSQVRFLSRGSGYSLFLTSSEAILTLRKPSRDRRGVETPSKPEAPSAVLRMRLVGANAKPEVAAMEELPSRSNYFIGNDPAKWRTNVPSYAKVRYEAVYPGVDLVYYGNQQQLEYDFVVAPGADPTIISLDFAGADRREVDDRGDLVLSLGNEQVRFNKPVIYQLDHGKRRQVPGRYVLGDRGQVSFAVAAYDATQALVIDPVLSYSTYLGGTSLDWGQGIAVDSSGSVYVAGRSMSTTGFPTTPGSLDSAGDVSGDAFVAKLDTTASGSASLLYSTFVGGGLFMEDQAFGIAVDASHNAYITGFTGANNFPLANAYQTTHGGGSADVFVTKLNASGNVLLYSTYLGGRGVDTARAIAVDSSGNAYVTGDTYNGLITPFPTTANAYQTAMNSTGFCCTMDAFVAKLNTNSSGAASLVYSTYLGGTAEEQGLGIAADAFGKVYVTGWTHSAGYFNVNAYDATANSFQDAFVAKLDTTVSGAGSMLYSTYLGGADHEWGNAIAIDSSGNAYVTGQTVSSDFPTLNGYQTSLGASAPGVADAFVAKLNPSAAGAASLLYSTYLGGTNMENGFGIAVDSSNYAYVTGSTSSSNFPTLNAYDSSLGGSSDAFVAKLDPALSGSASLIYSTYLGASADDTGIGIAVDAAGNAYVTGHTTSTDFPVLNAYQTSFGGNYDAFVTKLTDAAPPASADLSVSNVDAPDPVLQGNNITYTIVVTNGGPDAATAVTLTDPLPAGVAFASASAGCTESSGIVTCSVGNLANGGSATMTIVLTATAAGTITNTATVSSDVDDPASANDSASATTTVNPVADLSVTKSGAPDPVAPGGLVTFTIVVANSGPSAATGVILSDPITNGTLQSVTGPGCATVKAKGKTTATCAIGTLANGANATVTVVVAAPKKQGPMSDTATVTATEADPNTANNSATASVTVAR